MKRRQPKVWVDPAFRRQITAALLRQWALVALDYLDLPLRARLEIGVVDSDAIRELNQQYRGLDEPTDVLSFPYTPLAAPAPFYGEHQQAQPSDAAFPTPKGTGLPLGEVVLCFPYAQRQSAEQGQPLHDELRLLLVHGILHLVGHDHYEPDEERAMQATTNEILSKIAETSGR